MADYGNGKKIKEIAFRTLVDLVDEETAEIILEEAYVNLPKLKNDLESALQEKRLDDAIRFAHSIKGLFATMGLIEDAELARDCELKLREGESDISLNKEKIFSIIDDFMTTS